ncbi:MAG: FG-GAP repeat protein [Chthoniobacterales bacterium]
MKTKFVSLARRFASSSLVYVVALASSFLSAEIARAETPGKMQALPQNIMEDAKLTTTDGAEGDFIGESVSISGNRALVGGSQGELNTGAAYTFVFDGVSWKQEARLVGADVGPASYFGNSVSLSGNRALVGAVIDAHCGKTKVWRATEDFRTTGS